MREDIREGKGQQEKEGKAEGRPPGPTIPKGQGPESLDFRFGEKEAVRAKTKVRTELKDKTLLRPDSGENERQQVEPVSRQDSFEQFFYKRKGEARGAEKCSDSWRGPWAQKRMFTFKMGVVIIHW